MLVDLWYKLCYFGAIKKNEAQIRQGYKQTKLQPFSIRFQSFQFGFCLQVKTTESHIQLSSTNITISTCQ